ncbi:MAG: ABC transporter ATP-binding protein [Candidatus Lambdaproteobacteria bacterium]|nr:ABC transporter ATP-binding protein [Candidatus Lambdaproteobacteria bacterium]
MADVVLRVEGLTKRFGDFVAVRDLTFAITRGEVVGFLGQNGAGKSTTIKMICNLVRPTAGEIWLDGQPIARARAADHRRRLGAIVEAPRFYPQLSGRRNLELLARLHGVAPERVERLLHEVGLVERQAETFGRFSMGMKQRLGLAAVLLNAPSLIVLDEPTTGLDPVGQEQIHELIRDLAGKHQATILLSSHLLPEVAAICTRALVIHRGALILDQPLRDPSAIGAVERVFHGIAEEMNARGEIG